MDTLYTVKEAASKLRLSTKTVYALIKSGDLPCKTVGSRFRVSEQDLQKYLDRK